MQIIFFSLKNLSEQSLAKNFIMSFQNNLKLNPSRFFSEFSQYFQNLIMQIFCFQLDLNIIGVLEL